tara:strand:- start:509 stop:634 length:126 start_codon:yes stop_codon:yes gene_type:complete
MKTIKLITGKNSRNRRKVLATDPSILLAEFFNGVVLNLNKE